MEDERTRSLQGVLKQKVDALDEGSAVAAGKKESAAAASEVTPAGELTDDPFRGPDGPSCTAQGSDWRAKPPVLSGLARMCTRGIQRRVASLHCFESAVWPDMDLSSKTCT